MQKARKRETTQIKMRKRTTKKQDRNSTIPFESEFEDEW